jgi:hypothetical protein
VIKRFDQLAALINPAHPNQRADDTCDKKHDANLFPPAAAPEKRHKEHETSDGHQRHVHGLDRRLVRFLQNLVLGQLDEPEGTDDDHDGGKQLQYVHGVSVVYRIVSAHSLTSQNSDN